MGKKRVMALLLALTMVFAMLPVTVQATQVTQDVQVAAVAEGVQVAARGQNYRNVGLTPGATVNEMRFTWHSGQPVSRIVITDPANPGWQRTLTSVGRPLVAHQGTEAMGATTEMFPGRPGYSYYVHQVAVDDLSPETLYHYVVSWWGGQSSRKSFRTGGSDSFTFLVAGDPQIGVGLQTLALDGDGWQNTLDVALRAYPRAEFLLSVGDQIHTTNNSIEEAQRRHDAMFGPSNLSSLPLMPVVGNHDGSGLGNNNARLWPMHYNIPDSLDNVLRFNDQLYTQFDFWSRWGNVLVIQLDSNTTTWVNSVGGQSRLAFMENAIAQNADADWKVVTFHHPPYSVYRATNDTTKIQIIQNWIPEFERLGVDAVFSGHCHVYSRTHQMISNVPQPDQQWLNAAGQIRQDATGLLYNAVLDPTGIVYIAFNSASGSGYYNVAQMATRNYIAAYNQNFRRNFSAVSVTANTFEVATYQVNADGSFLLMDVYTIVRSVDGAVPAGYRFRQMGADVMQRVSAPDDRVGVLHGVEATAAGLGLPETVGIETDLRNNDGGNTATIRNAGGTYGRNVRTLRANVTWDVAGSDYDPEYTGAQSFTVSGVVSELPPTITNPNNVSLNVSINVTVFAYGDGPPPVPHTIPIAEANAAEYGTPVVVAGYVTAVLRNDRVIIQDSQAPWGGIFVTTAEPVADEFFGQWVIVEGLRSEQWAQPAIGMSTIMAHPDTSLVPLTPVLLPLGVFDNGVYSEWNSMLVSFYAELAAIDRDGTVHTIGGDGVDITLSANIGPEFQVGDRVRIDRAVVHWRADLAAERMHTDWGVGGVVRVYNEPLTVAEANMRENDTVVTVRGIAVNYYDTSPGNRNSVHLQDFDARTPFSGILVRGPLGWATDDVVGSYIIVTGVRNGDQVGSGFAEVENITITGIEAVQILDPNPVQPEPVLLPSLLALRGGAYRSMLVTLEGVQLSHDLVITGPGGVRPNFVLHQPYGAGDYTFAVACGIDGWHLVAGLDHANDRDNLVGRYITVHRAAIHWWQGRQEVQIRILDPESDVSFYVPSDDEE